MGLLYIMLRPKCIVRSLCTRSIKFWLKLRLLNRILYNNNNKKGFISFSLRLPSDVFWSLCTIFRVKYKIFIIDHRNRAFYVLPGNLFTKIFTAWDSIYDPSLIKTGYLYAFEVIFNTFKVKCYEVWTRHMLMSGNSF